MNCQIITFTKSLSMTVFFFIVRKLTPQPILLKALVTLFKTRLAENLAEKQVGLPMVGPGRPWAAP